MSNLSFQSLEVSNDLLIKERPYLASDKFNYWIQTDFYPSQNAIRFTVYNVEKDSYGDCIKLPDVSSEYIIKLYKNADHRFFNINKLINGKPISINKDESVPFVFSELIQAMLKDKECIDVFSEYSNPIYSQLDGLGLPLADIGFISRFVGQDYPLVYLVIVAMGKALVADHEMEISHSMLERCLSVQHLSKGQLAMLCKIEFPEVYNPDYIESAKKSIRFILSHWSSIPKSVRHEKSFRADVLLLYFKIIQMVPEVAACKELHIREAGQINYLIHVWYVYRQHNCLSDLDENQKFYFDVVGQHIDPIKDELNSYYSWQAYHVVSVLLFLKESGIDLKTLSSFKHAYRLFIEIAVYRLPELTRNPNKKSEIFDRIERLLPEGAGEYRTLIVELIWKLANSPIGSNHHLIDTDIFPKHQLVPNQFFKPVETVGELRSMAHQMNNCARDYLSATMKGVIEFWVYKDTSAPVHQEMAVLFVDLNKDTKLYPKIMEFSAGNNKAPSSKARRRLDLWIKSQPLYVLKARRKRGGIYE